MPAKMTIISSLYIRSFIVFTLSRILVCAALVLGQKFIPHNKVEGLWGAGDQWYHSLLRWDSGWYASIINNGYTYNPDPLEHSSTAFFPTYPILASNFSLITGIDTWESLLIISNFFSFILIIFLAKFVKEEFDEDTALYTVIFFSFFPYSLFLSAGYTESVFITFAIAGFIALRRRRFVFAAMFVALSLGTRSVGIAMVPALMWEIWRQTNRNFQSRAIMMLICCLIAFTGLLAYMAFLYISFGNPLAFATSQSAWHDSSFFERILRSLAVFPLFMQEDWYGVWYGLPSFIFSFGLSVCAIWYLRTSLWLYALGSVLVPYLTLGLTGSTGRFALACFPAFVVLAIYCKGRPQLMVIYLVTSATLLAIGTALYSQWYWVG